MIRVELGTSRKKLYFVKAEKDTAPNIGGYYCQVYYDEGCEFPVADYGFTIRKDQLSKNHTHAQLVAEVTRRVKAEYR